MQHERTRYGEQRFAFRPALGAFYALYAGAVGIGLVVFYAVLLVGSELWVSLPPAFLGTILLGALIVAQIALTCIVAGSYFLAGLQRLVWSHTTFGELRFGSTIQTTVLLGLLARNLLLVVLTAGVYWPFAAVAIARYRVESITVESEGPPPEIAARKHGNATAVGDAAFDLFGLDVGW
jgi:uncharacterized membrane protein YjgN (DUF898 family)